MPNSIPYYGGGGQYAANRPGTSDPNYQRRQALSQQLVGRSLQARPAYSWGEALANALTPAVQTWEGVNDQNKAEGRDKQFATDYGSLVNQWKGEGADPQALATMLSSSPNKDLAALAPDQVMRGVEYARAQAMRNEDWTRRVSESDKDRGIQQQQFDQNFRLHQQQVNQAGAGSWSEPRLLTGQDGKPVYVQFNSKGGHRVVEGLQAPSETPAPAFQGKSPEADSLNLVVAGQKDPKIREHPAYASAWRKLYTPHEVVNQETGVKTLVTPAPPPEGFIGPGRQSQPPVVQPQPQPPQMSDSGNFGMSLPPSLPSTPQTQPGNAAPGGGSVVQNQGGFTGRQPPETAVAGMVNNMNAVRKIDSAFAALSSNPDAIGLDKGAMNMVSPALLDRWDPGGVTARALVSDIGSLKIHDRSGAAVTASETPRLRPFIPSVTDSREIAAKKLTNFRNEYMSILKDQYSLHGPAQGFRGNPEIEKFISGGNAMTPPPGFKIIGP